MSVLLDDEARNAARALIPSFGKLREPMLRFSGWARAFNTSSPSGLWNVGNTSDSGKGLAQSPLRSPSVFNFFRPGYVPPNSPIGTAALVAPEFQIANESSVVGCINFMQRAVAGSVADLTPDYTSLLALADDAKALIDEINLVLAANQLGATTVATLAAALPSLTLALDAIAAHPNIAPFMSRQLIQRLVTSNPSPAYVARIAAVFADDGSGVRGNLRAVLRALLLDTEARTASTSASQGKLREPMLRFIGWARAWSTTSPSGAWAIGNTSDPGRGLAQSPLRSPSVFNFFRPGYVPPNTALGSAALAAPEFQIANESSVVGFVNFMQRAVAGSIGDITPDYASLVALADDAKALIDEINLVLGANQLSAATCATLAAAVQTMASGTDTTRRARINAALVLVLAAPEYIVQK